MSLLARFVLPGLVILSLLAFGASVFPIPSGDSHAFVPPALLLKAGGGLRNPISELARQLDPTGQARYLQYPPLFPWALSRLMARPTPAAAFLAIAGLNAVNVVLCALLFARAARSGPWAAALALLGTATLLAGEQTGRPEVLATLWVLLAIHVHLALPPERSWLPAGVILGLLGATHPVGALLLGLLAVLAYAVRLPTGRALRVSCGTLAVSLAVFTGILAASPFGLRETLEGMRRHGGAVAARGSQGALVTYWISNPGGTLYALPYLLLLALLAWRIWRRDLAVRSPVLFTVALLPLLGVVWRAGIQIPELSYNVLLFAPAVFAANLHLAVPPRRGGGMAAPGDGPDPGPDRTGLPAQSRPLRPLPHPGSAPRGGARGGPPPPAASPAGGDPVSLGRLGGLRPDDGLPTGRRAPAGRRRGDDPAELHRTHVSPGDPGLSPRGEPVSPAPGDPARAPDGQHRAWLRICRVPPLTPPQPLGRSPVPDYTSPAIPNRVIPNRAAPGLPRGGRRQRAWIGISGKSWSRGAPRSSAPI